MPKIVRKKLQLHCSSMFIEDEISAKRNLFIYYFSTKVFSSRSEYAHITIDKALSNFGVYHRICLCHGLEALLIDTTAILIYHILFASNSFVGLSITLNYFNFFQNF